jgi:TM2 domain
VRGWVRSCSNQADSWPRSADDNGFSDCYKQVQLIRSMMEEAALAESCDKKFAVGLLGIFLGAFGIHKFALGHVRAGMLMLLVSLLFIGKGTFLMGLIGILEGIVCMLEGLSGKKIDAL